MSRSLHKNIKTIYLLGFFNSFMVVTPVYVPLLQGHGLSMSQVLQTQALFALTIALFEVPSGYIADTWGRRRAILLGSAFFAVGFLCLWQAESFVDFLLYEAILGIGYSLISGADLALLYDTEVYLREQKLPGGATASKSLSRLISVEAAASGIAGIVASVLLLWSIETVVAAQAIISILPLCLAFLLVEVPQPKVDVSHNSNARSILELLLFGKPVVLWTALAIAVFGLLAVYVFWIYQKYWEHQGIPTAWYGYIWAAFALTVSVAARFASTLEQRMGTRGVLCLIGALPLIGLAGMALGSGWIGVAFGFALQVSRGLSMSLFYEALNRRVPGNFRATVNSLVSFGVRVVFIGSGPLLGYALDSIGVVSTLLLLLAIFTPAIAVVLVPLLLRIRREKVSEEPHILHAG
ncbi:MFS transporter [Candidatus Marimicrobium litorale]|uniref:MFS transporter n=1 Tax=Candidatus Marimicrobium litorale TaxID=2518991 RepID=A0ABT3T7G1_9GAMM|nr:MFS transporter [Candidatus Marimicrobium litorale]MCX2977432.1 MFS transporter [Candidatus Marimicrobium litorale]